MNSFLKIVCSLIMRLVELSSRLWVRCAVPETSVIMGFSNIDASTTIGENTFINRFCEITSASIGNYCSIGSGVRIGSGEHNFKLMSTSSFVTGHTAVELTSSPCTIGNDVWIGTQAFIKRGIVVGDGAVIGAGAVVTKDIPPFAIAVGTPARIIKYRFDEKKQKELQEAEWWNKSVSIARLMAKEFQSDQ